jgi:osmoprotectant transport system substrate-binding protein
VWTGDRADAELEWKARLWALPLALAAALLSGAGGAGAAPVVVSSKLSSESALIGHMIRLLLEANGIPTVDRMTLAGTPIMRRAIIAGMVDVYVEYTGNAGFFFNVASDPAWKDLGQGYVLGARLDYAAHRIVWLTPANASNAWALAVRSDVAAPAGLRTMTDFGRWVSAGGRVVLACSAEFANSATLKSLERTYGFTLRPEQLIVLAGGDTSATIRAAAERTSGTNTAMVYGTDGAIVAAKLEVLDDDRHDQPIYAPVPIIREATLKAHPEIATIVRPLMESFDRATLTELNARIQINGEPPVSVAEDYLRSRGLLGVAPAAPLPRRVGGQ